MQICIVRSKCCRERFILHITRTTYALCICAHLNFSWARKNALNLSIIRDFYLAHCVINVPRMTIILQYPETDQLFIITLLNFPFIDVTISDSFKLN